MSFLKQWILKACGAAHPRNNNSSGEEKEAQAQAQPELEPDPSGSNSNPSLEILPDAVLIEILTCVALHDPNDLGRCRLISRRLRSLSNQLYSIRIVCSRNRVLQSRTDPTVVPFKQSIINLVSPLRHLESLSIVLPYLFHLPLDVFPFDTHDDVHLTDSKFLLAWLPGIGRRLRTLELTTYAKQSSYRNSDFLQIVSHYCEKLVRLEVRNARLSVKGLKSLPMLTKLTLEYITLDDKDLDKVNACFPSLQVLNLIGIMGIENPKIRLPNLKTFHWAVCRIPISLTICAPSLTELKLSCFDPRSFILKAPLLSNLYIRVDSKIQQIEVENMDELRSLRIESPTLWNLVEVFTRSTIVEILEIETRTFLDSDKSSEIISFQELRDRFPGTRDLKLGQLAWCKIVKSIPCETPYLVWEWRSLKRLTINLRKVELNYAYISYIHEMCPLLCEMVIVFPRYTNEEVQNCFMSRLAERYQNIKWSSLSEK